MSENEFEVFGLNSARVSVIYGVILVVFAVLISLISGSDSLTSYIPAMFGLPILILGLIAVWAPSKQKLVMHINVVIGLLIFLAGLSVIPSLVSGVNLSTSLWANVSKLFMSLTGALYLTICVKSFIFIRRKRGLTEMK